jgi:hypothetical protein
MPEQRAGKTSLFSYTTVAEPVEVMMVTEYGLQVQT